MDIITFLDKNIAVFSTLSVTLLTAFCTWHLQKANNKSKLNEMTHATFLKLKEFEYQDKRTIISKTLRFLENLNGPSYYSFDTSEETANLYFIETKEMIKNEINDFHISYSIYANAEVSKSLQDLHICLVELEEVDFNATSQDIQAELLNNFRADYCSTQVEKLILSIENFKIVIKRQLDTFVLK